MGKGRAPCCDKSQVKKGPWSPAEDLKLIAFIQKHGHENWRALPKQAGLMRCGKSCRLRWINYLRPDVKRGNFTAEEEETIIKLHKAMGNKWSKIASRLPGRTDNEIKNVWNTHLKKRLSAKSSDSVADNNNNNAHDGSRIESSSVTSPSSSSSSESFFSNEETPNTNNNNNNNNLCRETNDHNVSQTDQEPKGPSNSSSSSSLSSCVENKHHDDEDHNQQQLVSPPLLNYVGPYDVDVTLEEVDKPNSNNLETREEEEDGDFWKMLDNIETFLSSNEVSSPPPPPHQSQTSPPNLVHQDDGEAMMMMMWSHELENELNGVVADETTTKGSNNNPQQDIIMDPNDDVLHDQLELELDLGFIQLWPSLPQNTP
ncbi:hypothetical protein PIB30_052556 [Stylosanthes scabra]|uniref:Uncharacterized protein n=1 Tax=Stylosanthes scabra TaxID=79078 RepID=A0ABU6VGR0_9FABA|nr:hypothetical protein [Stylosanthes scabra]